MFANFLSSFLFPDCRCSFSTFLPPFISPLFTSLLTFILPYPLPPTSYLLLDFPSLVAVALRNQKVSVSDGNGRVTQVSVTMPTLSELTICFEVQRNVKKQVPLVLELNV